MNLLPAPADPCAFIETLTNPETREPFQLTEAERVFLKHAFTPTDTGRMRYPELMFGAPKKSGKTALAALITIFMVRVLGGRFAEGYCLANDLEQASGRVYQAISRIIEASPALLADAKITVDKITFKSTGGTIQAISHDFASAAGANPTISVFDELWGYTSERSHRLWDEMVPPPTRRLGCRLTVTYAGFEGESALLEGLYNRGLLGEQIAADLWAQPGMLMFWTNRFTAPWQTEEWREQMRQQLRPSAYLRLVENRWVSSESTFVDMAWWEECTSPGLRPLLNDLRLPVWLGVDASVKRDSTAVVAVTYDSEAQRVRLVTHRIFQPSPDEPLDFEGTVEATVLELARRFSIVECRFDPYQMQAVAQRLMAAHVPMLEFPQTTANLTAASTGLYELVKARNLTVYPDDQIRLAISRAIALESSRGWKIAKEKAGHKIDVVVALAQAAYGAVQASMGPPALIAPDLLLEDGKPARMPEICDVAAAVLTVDDRGAFAAAFFAYGRNFSPPLVLVDFDVGGVSTETVSEVVSRLEGMRERIRVRFGLMLFTTENLFPHLRGQFDAAMPIPAELLADPAALSLAAASHVGRGAVRIAVPAYQKAQRHSLGSVLALRPGATAHPLQTAIVAGIVVALSNRTDIAA